MKKDWWKTFFEDQIGNFLFNQITPQKTRREAEEILRRTKLKHGSHILDLACGRGRHTIEFARRKFKVSGLDYSSLYISDAVRLAKSARVQNRTEFLKGDMRNLTETFQPDTFDCVVSLFNSFGYFDDKSDDKRVIGATRVKVTTCAL